MSGNKPEGGGGKGPLRQTSPLELPDCQYIIPGGGKYTINPVLGTFSLDNFTLTSCPLMVSVAGVNVPLRLTIAIDLLSLLSVKLKTSKVDSEWNIPFNFGFSLLGGHCWLTDVQKLCVPKVHQ
jgi:hypothetical protein